MNLKYIFGAFICLPLLPILYFDGKKIRKNIPILPEAKEPFGVANAEFKKKLNIICVGESTIAGVGADYHKNAFSGSLANELSLQLNASISWKVYAKSGYTVKRISEKIIPKIEEKTADLIVIGIGGNEAFTLNSPKKFKKQIILLIDELQEKFPNTPILFTNMPPIKGFTAFTKTIKFVVGNLVEILGSALEKTVKNDSTVFYNSEIITLKNWKKRNNLQGSISDFFSDGVHPSQLAYQVWGKEMASFIVSNHILK